MTRLTFAWPLAAAIVAVPLVATAKPLPSDPRVQQGKLANGVTWMYRQHDNPPGKMALLVHVASGSLNETDAQQGLAHFLEHMCFNGTENHPPGTLVKYFESIGMEFGADLNAFTSFDQTAYMLFLPNAEVASVDKALMTLSDYLFRAQLLTEEIDKERGVVMEEWRRGQSAQQRIRDKMFKLVFPGTRFANRLPIGQTEVIENAPRSEFVDYYRTWYRPEKVTLVMVGDAPIGGFKPAIEKWFGQYRAEMSIRSDKGPELKPFTEPRTFVITDPEMHLCQIQMGTISAARPPVTTTERFRIDLLDDLATWMVNRRMEERVQKGEATYQRAYTYVADFFKGGTMADGMATGEPAKWGSMLEELIIEVNRAREHGFTEREFELARKEYLASYERTVETEPTRNARGLMFNISNAVNETEPVMSAQQRLDLVSKMLPGISLSEVSTAFKGHFGSPNFTYVVSMPEGEGVVVPSSDDVMAMVRSAWARKTEAPSEAAADQQLLEVQPTPGTIADSTHDADLGITSAWLSNGVRIHHRFMDYKKDAVLVSVGLAGGRIEEKADDSIGLTQLVAAALREQPATSRLDSTAVRDLMTGVKVGVSVGASPDTLTLNVSGSPTDLDTGMELAYALLTDGRIEDSAVNVWKQRQNQRHAMAQAFPDFKAFETMSTEVFGGDPRVQPMVAPERIAVIETAAAQASFDRMRADAPIEVAIVGDIQADAAMDLAKRYLAALPARDRQATRLDALRTLPRPTGPINGHVDVKTMSPKGTAIAGFVACEYRNVKERRAMKIASNILSSRLIERIREELGLVYSLRAINRPSMTYRDAGLFMTMTSCNPENADKVTAEAHTIFESFAKQGPTDEELVNAKKQIANNLDEQLREPRYWLGVLGDLSYHHKRLEDEKAERTAYDAYTQQQVHGVFRKYYQPERMFTITATPAPAPTATEKAEEDSPVS